MEKTITMSEDKLFSLDEIPKRVYNRELTEQQRERLASGRQTNLIKDIVMEEGKRPIDAKITAVRNEDGNLELTYDYAEKQFKMPTRILGKVLTEEQKNKMFEGELINIAYKGKDYFVGMDKELNSITVKSARQIGIPEKVAGYQLNVDDKLDLANGEAIKTKLYKTPENDYFTATLRLTSDNKGITFEDIKFVDKENVKDLIEKYNKPELRNAQAMENTMTMAKDILDTAALSFDNSRKSPEVIKINLELSDKQQSSISEMLDTGIYSENAKLSSSQLSKIPDEIDGIRLDDEKKYLLATEGRNGYTIGQTNYKLADDGVIERADSNGKIALVTANDVRFEVPLDKKQIEERFPIADEYRGLGKGLYNELLLETKSAYSLAVSGPADNGNLSEKKKDDAQIDWALNNLPEAKPVIKTYLATNSYASLEKVSDEISFDKESIVKRFPPEHPTRGLDPKLFEMLEAQSSFDFFKENARQGIFLPEGPDTVKRQMDWAFENIKFYEPMLVHESKASDLTYKSDYIVRSDATPETIYQKFVPSQLENPQVKAQDANEIEVNDPKEISGTSKDSRKEQRPVIEYTDVKANETGFSIKATEYFVPTNLKGVKLSEEQKDGLSKGDKVYVEGMTIKGQKTSAFVQINEKGSGIKFDFDRDGKTGKSKVAEKNKSKDDFNLAR